MAAQQQNASFSARLGSRVAAANAQHRDKPIDTGMQRLPAGIKNGVAQLQVMETKQQTKDDGKVPKGEVYFRASAVVLWPEEHSGRRCAGLHTSLIIPLCDIPAKGERKAVSFDDNWYTFQNLFKLLSNGAIVCPETPQTDPTSKKTEAFYFAAMKSLTNPQHPVYITFSTRKWMPPKTPQNPNPEEMVYETWHGLATEADLRAAGLLDNDPAAGVSTDAAPQGGLQPAPMDAPPPTEAFVEPPRNEVVNSSVTTEEKTEDSDEEIAYLVEVAMSDPNGESEEGASAARQLEEMAWERGWTQEQTRSAEDWVAVGRMASVGPDEAVESSADQAAIVPTPGSKWKFAKRDRNGKKLKNGEGKEFPAQEVEVVTVDTANETVTLKYTKDGKDVVGVGSKKPLAIKWEYLE